MRKKIEKALHDAMALKKSGAFPKLKCLYFVTPFDLNQDAHICLMTRAKASRLKGIAWGETTLLGILARHPEIKAEFPELLLPDLLDEETQVRRHVEALAIRDIEQLTFELGKLKADWKQVAVVLEQLERHVSASPVVPRIKLAAITALAEPCHWANGNLPIALAIGITHWIKEATFGLPLAEGNGQRKVAIDALCQALLAGHLLSYKGTCKFSDSRVAYLGAELLQRVLRESLVHGLGEIEKDVRSKFADLVGEARTRGMIDLATMLEFQREDAIAHPNAWSTYNHPREIWDLMRRVAGEIVTG